MTHAADPAARVASLRRQLAHHDHRYYALDDPDISDAGIQDHLLWGVMLLVTVLHGPGRWSLDHWLKQRWQGAVA